MRQPRVEILVYIKPSKKPNKIAANSPDRMALYLVPQYLVVGLKGWYYFFGLETFFFF